MKKSLPALAIALFAIVGVSSACAHQDNSSTSKETATTNEEFAAGNGEFQVNENLVTAGQPGETRVVQLAKMGVKVISLRRLSEETFDEEALARANGAAGDNWQRFATTGEQLKDKNFRSQVFSSLQAAEGMPVYLHCGSGNRAGAIWALYQVEVKGLSPEDAIAAGKNAGLKSLEPLVREILTSESSPNLENSENTAAAEANP